MVHGSLCLSPPIAETRPCKVSAYLRIYHRWFHSKDYLDLFSHYKHFPFICPMMATFSSYGPWLQSILNLCKLFYEASPIGKHLIPVTIILWLFCFPDKEWKAVGILLPVFTGCPWQQWLCSTVLRSSFYKADPKGALRDKTIVKFFNWPCPRL